MEKVLVNIGNKSYRCDVASDEKSRRQGLQNVEYLAPDEGMLFIFEDDDTHEMWMKDCSLEIDIISISEDEEVITVYTPIPNDDTLIPFPKSKYILEVNKNSGIQVGDSFDIDDSEDLNKYTMKILAPDGSTQMLLQGGERIFSRVSTKKFIKWAKKADSVKDDEKLFNSYCKRLGKLMLKEIHAQNNREPEYVEVKN